MLNFNFSGVQAYTSGNLTAGGSILYSTTPFQWAWDCDGRADYEIFYNNWNVGTPWYGFSGSLTSTASLTLNAAFGGGALYVAIVPWNNTPLKHSIDVPGGASPSAVPLPAAGLMLSGAVSLMGGLAALRRRRRHRGRG